MGIDIQNEKLIKLGEACRMVPPDGVSLATMSRWIQRGVRGVILETVVIGKARLTTKEALARFFTAMNQGSSPQPVVTAKRRKSMAQSAVSQLEAAGA